jgi:hypothetical protein
MIPAKVSVTFITNVDAKRVFKTLRHYGVLAGVSGKTVFAYVPEKMDSERLRTLMFRL